jgi:hypothetical protein
MASNTTTTQDSQDHLGMFYERAIRTLDKIDSTPINKPLNYIDVLDENIQGLIGEYLSPFQSYDWELACQGEEVLAMIEEEYYQEDETRDWRDDPRQDWEDDFDLYQEWEQENEDDMYEDYGDCYVNEYGDRVHNARFSAGGYLAR